MNFMQFYTESNGWVNKFNTLWQVARLKAKDLKDVDAKISLVKKCLLDNPSPENFGRVSNWTSMTKLGYKNSSLESVRKFEDFLDYLENNKNDFTAEDKDMNLEDLPEDIYIRLYQDLKGRKNNLHHGGKRPVSMSQYLAEMEKIAAKRDIDLEEKVKKPKLNR